MISRSAMNELRLAAILFGVSAPAAFAQDIAAGEISFSRCLGCHAIGVNAKNKIGPQLNGIDGRKCGTVEGYTYSTANKDCSFTWNETDFVQYIRDPKAKIPGTKKSISGIRDQARRKTSGPICVSSGLMAGRNRRSHRSPAARSGKIGQIDARDQTPDEASQPSKPAQPNVRDIRRRLRIGRRRNRPAWSEHNDRAGPAGPDDRGRADPANSHLISCHCRPTICR